ncbi:ABC transporter substrate-binding protein, partial [Kitasatospora sp. NPDC058965]
MNMALRRTALVTSIAGLALASAACGSAKQASGSGGASGATGSGAALRIALLLPETKTTRYEQFDKPLIEAKIKELAPNATVDYYNANQDAT